MNHHAPLVASVLLFAAVSIVDYGQRRRDYEVCQEVTREVNLHVRAGLLTQAEADRISQRCFTEFVQ